MLRGLARWRVAGVADEHPLGDRPDEHDVPEPMSWPVDLLAMAPRLEATIAVLVAAHGPKAAAVRVWWGALREIPLKVREAHWVGRRAGGLPAAVMCAAPAARPRWLIAALHGAGCYGRSARRVVMATAESRRETLIGAIGYAAWHG